MTCDDPDCQMCFGPSDGEMFKMKLPEKNAINFDEFQTLSMRSFKADPGLTVQQSKAMLGSIGLAGEVGECTEPVKKWFFHHNRTADEVRSELLEEIGDVLWYAACLASAFDLSLQEIAEYNVKKLEKRYPERVAT